MGMPELVLGDFNLTDWTGSVFGVSVIAEGTSKGSPVPIESAVKSWLQDGSVVVTQGYDNRTVTLRVRLRGPDLLSVAEAEAALFAELGKPNTLTWDQGDGFSPPTVFVVVTSSMDLAPSADEDIAERLAYPWRTYNLRLVCEAFTRSDIEVTAPALAANGTTTTLVNDGSATTGWTGSVNGTTTAPSVSSGAVKVTNGAPALGAVTCSLTLTAAITTSSTKYLVIDWKPESGAGAPDLRAYGDGIELFKVGESASPTSGYTRTWFYVVAASIAVLRLDSTTAATFATAVFPAATRSLYVDNINRTDIKPSLGSTRQLLRSIEVAGSARASGSLAIEHATSALGDVILYVFPDAPYTTGYVPSLRQYFVSGGTTTTDAAMVSGARNDTGFTPQVYDIPATKLAAGSHTLMVKGGTGTAGTPTMTWSAQMRINGTNVGPAVSGSSVRATSTAQTIYALGRIMLPVVDVNESNANAVVRITISTTLNSFDEAWLFNTTIGDLVGPVSCGTSSPASGGSANRLFIEPPTTTSPRPSLRIGFAADRSDSYFPAALSGLGFLRGWQLPRFCPSRVNVFTVTTNALDASVTLRHYPRWFTHAAS